MRESNPGRLGEKRERFLCAMPSPQAPVQHLELTNELVGVIYLLYEVFREAAFYFEAQQVLIYWS